LILFFRIQNSRGNQYQCRRHTRKEFLLEGHSGAALDTVSHMFEGVGFNTYVSQINNK
jgi:hypothetical protein